MLNKSRVTCPHCGVRFRIPFGFTGETIGCPGCWKGLKLTDVISTPPRRWWRSRLTLVRDWINSWRRPPDPRTSEGFLETRQWALDYIPPREDEVYAIALDYAEKRYEEMLNLSEALDKKLDDLARTSLAIGVLIATVARVLGAETPLGRSRTSVNLGGSQLRPIRPGCDLVEGADALWYAVGDSQPAKGNG
jgi:hypothetical protein